MIPAYYGGFYNTQNIRSSLYAHPNPQPPPTEKLLFIVDTSQGVVLRVISNKISHWSILILN